MAYGSGQKKMLEIIKDVAVALHKFPNTRLVLKLHPSEIKKVYEKRMQNIGENVIILDRENIYELLNSTEALITMDSTTGLEAMTLGKPVIIFPKEEDDFLIYKNTNAVLHASNQKELEKAMELVFLCKGKEFGKLKKNMQKFLFDYSFKQDRKATERIVKLIKEKSFAKKIAKKNLKKFEKEY